MEQNCCCLKGIETKGVRQAMKLNLISLKNYEPHGAFDARSTFGYFGDWLVAHRNRYAEGSALATQQRGPLAGGYD